MGLRQVIKKPYFVVKANMFVWSNIVNQGAQALLKRYPAHLSEKQRALVKEVTEKGVAVTSLSELFPDRPKLLEQLVAYAKSLEGGMSEQTKKKFLRHYWGLDVELDFSNPFVRFSLDPMILNIANSYMGMMTRLKHYTLNLTIPVPETEKPQFSQKWHRDPQERRMIKAFIYLTDVDEGCGPFTYVPGSTYGNTYGSLFPQKPPEGSYPPEGAIEKMIPEAERRSMTGKAGTVIFCDTTGIHRGGYATRGERLMFTSFYCAPSYVDSTWYTKPTGFQVPPEFDTPAVRFALGEN